MQFGVVLDRDPYKSDVTDTQLSEMRSQILKYLNTKPPTALQTEGRPTDFQACLKQGRWCDTEEETWTTVEPLLGKLPDSVL